jgi:hypothetical protein
MVDAQIFCSDCVFRDHGAALREEIVAAMIFFIYGNSKNSQCKCPSYFQTIPNLIDKQNKFLNEQEALQIAQDFEAFYVDANHSGSAKKVELRLSQQTLDLPPRAESLLATYIKDPSQKFTAEDEDEWMQNKHKEQPCISIKDWDAMNLEMRLKTSQEAMRGIGSDQIPPSRAGFLF